MKKIFLIILIIFLFSPILSLKAESQASLAERLSGRILLQVESYGRAWYVHPGDLTRYYLKNGGEAYNIMRDLSLGITNSDLAKIPTTAGENYDFKLVERLKGLILLQVEEHGQAWYLNPVDGLRYYLKDGQAAYNIMRALSLGISNENLKQIPVNQQQIIPDTAFDQVAYSSYQEENFIASSYGDIILPLASLTKLMTALVFLDTNPNWDQIVTITASQINYPKYYVGDDATSEIDLKVGDQVKLEDLWVALLVASSNQSTVALVDQSGYSRSKFVARMNLKAEQLGLNKTRFFDVAGLDAHNVSTAEEMAKIAALAFAQDKIKQTSQITNYTITTVQEREIKVANRNYSLLQFEPDACKTGFLVEAQRTVALEKAGRVIVILHARSMAERNNIIKKLLE